MKNLIVILGMLFTLSVNAQQVQISGPTSICAGNIASLTVTPNDTLGTYRYVWTPSLPDTHAVQVSPLVTTTWTVTVLIDSSSVYVGQTSATIVVNQLPTATATNSGPHCVATTINLMASGGINYVWSGPNGLSSNQQNPQLIATLAANGTYTVTVTDNNGCSASASTNVVVNPGPTPPTVGSNSPVCVGGNIILAVNNGYASYNWTGPNGFSSNQQNPVLSNVTLAMSGTYQVDVTDGNGCGSSTGYTVTVNPTPAVTAVATDVACFGDSSGSASVSQSGLSYLWNTGDTTQTVSGLPAGNYSVTATNNFGCSATTTAVVNQPSAALTASMTVNDALCNGSSDGSIVVSGAGGNGPYQYRINNGPWMGGLSYTFTGLAAGTYTVDVRDVNACQITLTASVFQPSVVTANADSSAVSCNGGSNGTVWVLPNGGTPPYTYGWSNGATTQFVSSLTAGTYSVTVTDANGCTTTAATAVTQPSPITFSPIISNALCNGGNGTISFTNVGGGTAPYTYSINGGNTYGTNSIFSVPVGSYQLRVMDANGCSTTNVPIAISAPTAIQLTIADTNAVCGGNGIASVFASGGTAPYNFLWSNGSTNDTISTGPGSYQVTVTDANGCVAVGAATIGQPIIPTITGSVTDVNCFGQANGAVDITPSGVGPFTYSWTNGSTNQDLVNVGAGIYTVIVTGANSCIGTNQFTVFQLPILTTTITNDTVNCYGDLGALTVNVSGGTAPYSYGWNTVPGQTTQTAINLAPGLGYTAIVVDANGCIAQASAVVTQPSQMVASIQSQSDAGCFGNSNGAITVTAAGGTQPYSPLVQWNDGFVGGPVRTGLSTGSYTATITDANGCSASVTTTINGSTSQMVVQWYSVQNPCSGTNNGGITVNASGGVGPYTFTWGDGFVGPVRTGLPAGTYTVTITDATGCQAGPFEQTLTANQGIVITTSSVVNYCVGSGETISLTATGGTQPYGYQWTSPNGTFFGTSQAIEPMVNGQYLGGIWTGVVTDGLGCSQTTYITVNLITCSTTSINEQSNDGFQISVFPNPIPSGQNVTIKLPSLYNDVNIELINIHGQILIQDKVVDEIYQLNTSGLSPGAYIVRIASHDQLITKKLVVAK